MIRIGHSILRDTPSVTLPMTNLSNPPLPWDPIITKSYLFDFAYAEIFLEIEFATKILVFTCILFFCAISINFFNSLLICIVDFLTSAQIRI